MCIYIFRKFACLGIQVNHSNIILIIVDVNSSEKVVQLWKVEDFQLAKYEELICLFIYLICIQRCAQEYVFTYATLREASIRLGGNREKVFQIIESQHYK